MNAAKNGKISQLLSNKYRCSEKEQVPTFNNSQASEIIYCTQTEENNKKKKTKVCLEQRENLVAQTGHSQGKPRQVSPSLLQQKRTFRPSRDDVIADNLNTPNCDCSKTDTNARQNDQVEIVECNNLYMASPNYNSEGLCRKFVR